MKKLKDILRLSEIQDLTDSGLYSIHDVRDINFLKIWELTSLYSHIQFENVTNETVKLAEEHDLLKAMVVLNELSVRLLKSEK